MVSAVLSFTVEAVPGNKLQAPSHACPIALTSNYAVKNKTAPGRRCLFCYTALVGNPILVAMLPTVGQHVLNAFCIGQHGFPVTLARGLVERGKLIPYLP